MIHIKAGWFVDGTGGPILKDVLLEIKKGKIASIGKIESFPLVEEDVMDYSRCTVLPLFIDCHVHLAMSGTEDPEFRQQQLRASFTEIRGVIAKNLQEQFDHGVIALRDGGDRSGYTLRYKGEFLIHDEISVPYVSAGKAWHAEGRYGGLIGRPPVHGSSLSASILKETVHMDHIKIINSGLNSLTCYGLETPPQFDIEPLREAISMGKDRGLSTMVHANGREAVRAAIEAGCHSIEHGFFMGDENLRRLRDHDIVWVPTIFTMETLSRIMMKQGDKSAEIAKKNLEHQINQVSRAVDYGVVIAAGTDSGSPGVHHGAAIAEEIRMLISAGLSLEKAIQCATCNGSVLLNVQGQTGRLIPGMPASFVVTRGGTDCMPGALNSPLSIWVHGKQVKQHME